MKSPMRTIWLLCMLGLVCSACGQKGKLVMPVRPPQVSTPYPTSLPKEDDADQKDRVKESTPDNQPDANKN